MNVPNLPTDNLYKFQATAGLLLVIVGLLLPIWGLSQVEGDTNQLSIDLTELEAEHRWVTEDLEQIDLKITRFEAVGDTLNPRLAELREEKRRATRELVVRTASLRGRLEVLKIWERRMKRLLIAGAVLVLWGTWFATRGFNRWYHRYQVYLDKIIANQANNLEKEEETAAL